LCDDITQISSEFPFFSKKELAWRTRNVFFATCSSIYRTVLQKLIIAKFNDYFMHEISTVNYPTNFAYAKLVVQDFSVFSF